MKKKILLVFGTRPEAIKMAPVVKAFRRHAEHFETRICVTAQHREMLDQVLDIFGLVPDFDLNIMQPDQDLYDISVEVLLRMKQVFNQFLPDALLVHGDTTTSAMAALAAFYRRVPVGHVEAGLRTGNIYSPWPEEMNRRLTAAMAAWHFAPTETARQQLLAENIPAESIQVTGNTVVDALMEVAHKLKENAPTLERTLSGLKLALGASFSKVIQSRFILITAHRRENFGEGFLNICHALKDLALGHPDIHLIYPVHLNPKVRVPVHSMLGGMDNVHLIEPLSYLPFIYLMENCSFVITDSGGLQEEAPAFGKPVLLMRDTTERPEAVAAGTVRLVGTHRERILSEASRLLNDTAFYRSMVSTKNPFGDGKAADRIVRFFIQGQS